MAVVLRMAVVFSAKQEIPPMTIYDKRNSQNKKKQFLFYKKLLRYQKYKTNTE